ncbi:hypothetical protein BJ912DRAFT_1059628 [Pholiota molesta]|nr:hypothetical protein BJ912DRAFT_1059628 [Pholiota molesta]
MTGSAHTWPTPPPTAAPGPHCALPTFFARAGCCRGSRCSCGSSVRAWLRSPPRKGEEQQGTEALAVGGVHGAGLHAAELQGARPARGMTGWDEWAEEHVSGRDKDEDAEYLSGHSTPGAAATPAPVFLGNHLDRLSLHGVSIAAENSQLPLLVITDHIVLEHGRARQSMVGTGMAPRAITDRWKPAP